MLKPCFITLEWMKKWRKLFKKKNMSKGLKGRLQKKTMS